MPDGSATAHTYRPKLLTVLSDGYGLGCFRKDMLAALTVAIVALPLSMAIAASGLRAQVGGLKVAVRNAQDGVSVVQTAEGALKITGRDSSGPFNR